MTASMNFADIRADDLIFGHTSAETALEVGNYPYGRLRTTIRYWIETTKNGDRFVAQTINPKNGRLNAPKKSTYSEAMVLYRDRSNFHIGTVGVSMYLDPELLQHFLDITEGRLSDLQRAKVARVIAMNKVFANVTWTISENSGPATDEEKSQADKVYDKINHAVAVETRRAFENLS